MSSWNCLPQKCEITHKVIVLLQDIFNSTCERDIIWCILLWNSDCADHIIVGLLEAREILFPYWRLKHDVTTAMLMVLKQKNLTTMAWAFQHGRRILLKSNLLDLEWLIATADSAVFRDIIECSYIILLHLLLTALFQFEGHPLHCKNRLARLPGENDTRIIRSDWA